jgi:hypothetical protein
LEIETGLADQLKGLGIFAMVQKGMIGLKTFSRRDHRFKTWRISGQGKSRPFTKCDCPLDGEHTAQSPGGNKAIMKSGDDNIRQAEQSDSKQKASLLDYPPRNLEPVLLCIHYCKTTTHFLNGLQLPRSNRLFPFEAFQIL